MTYQGKHQNQAAGCALCPVFGRCGGCSRLDIPYDQQLAAKDARMRELYGDLAAPGVLQPILGMEDPFHYRNKVMSPFAPGKQAKKRPQAKPAPKGKGAGKRPGGPAAPILTGMYAPGTHRLIPTDQCAIENQTGKRVVLAVRSIMQRWHMEPYNEDTGEGFVRHVVVRVGHESGEVLVTVVTNAEEFPASKSFCRELVKRVPEITTIVQNINTRQTNVVLGDKERVLYGPGFILDTLCGLSFRISSKSFYQVNATQTEVLYNEAISMAQLSGEETFIDAYCGTGTIGLVAAARGAKRVIGVDSVSSAIKDARQNAQHNGIVNAEFVCEDATRFMREAAKDRQIGQLGLSAEGPFVLMMDPPRAGSTPEFLDAAAALHPDRIVYISCNPTTQARDLRHLVQSGYQIDRIQPVDMFPHTDHVESIAALTPAARS